MNTTTNRTWCDGLDRYEQRDREPARQIQGFDYADVHLFTFSSETFLPVIYFNFSIHNPLEVPKYARAWRWERRADENVGDTVCYVVAVDQKLPSSSPSIFWIGKQDFLIRRYREHFVTQTHENIVVNETLRREDFVPAGVLLPTPQDAPKSTAGGRPEGEGLSAKDILARVRRAYASLSTYRDTGWAVHDSGGEVWTNRFTELLGTRTCYRAELAAAPRSPLRSKTWSSDGLHDFSYPADELDDLREETILPAIYFNLHYENGFARLSSRPATELARRADEKIGNVDCYVVAGTTPASPVTLWCGKQDFLIRRYRNDASHTTETHENIVVNETVDRSEYGPASVAGDKVEDKVKDKVTRSQP